MIKDKHGRWMSKSLGNGIDPLEMIEQYGADAVRFCLTILCAQGQDIKLDPTKFEMGRNFANKIWNAYNVFGQFMEPGKDYRRQRSFDELDLVERWMLTRLARTIEGVGEDLERYRLNEALTRIYTLFWGDFCDWYLELIKPPYGEEMDEDRIALAVEIYEQLLRLLHPFMPFITEQLYADLRPRDEGDVCMLSDWPAANEGEAEDADAEVFQVIQDLIGGIRNIKSQYNVPPSKDIAARLHVEERLVEPVRRNAVYFERLARVTDLDVGADIERPAASASAVVGRNQAFVPLEGMIDLDIERERLRKEIDNKSGFLASVQRKLQNEQFVTKAPEQVVKKEREKEKDAMAELKRLEASLEELS
jgi:valyl-tRNA synthetase